MTGRLLKKGIVIKFLNNIICISTFIFKFDMQYSIFYERFMTKFKIGESKKLMIHKR